MGKRRTNPNDIAVALVEGLDVLVLEARNADECHPELREPACDWSWVASERMDGGDAVDKYRQNEGGQICREIRKKRTKKGMLSGIGEEGEEDGAREKNGSMETDVVPLVLAEHLGCCLWVFRIRGPLSVRKDSNDGG